MWCSVQRNKAARSWASVLLRYGEYYVYRPWYMLEIVAGAVRKSKSDIVLSTLAVSLYTE